MDAPATVVWLAPQPPDAEQSRALQSWARAHGMSLTPPNDRRAPSIEVDPHLGDGVEAWLERAHDAIASHDGEQADDALSAAESALRAHPELPQAAWLMAEVERARAMRWRKVPPADVEAAEGAWMRAESLDGGRVAGVGEESAHGHPSAATLALDLSPDDAEPWLDGKPVNAAGAATTAGPHALVVTSGGAAVWAGWLELPRGGSTVHVSASAAPACSSEDVSRARVAEHVPARVQERALAGVEPGHVRCPAWVAAMGGSQPDSVRVAVCESSRCGPFFEWHAPARWSWSPSVADGRERGERSAWPAWATWAFVGGGAAIAAGVVVLASGALQTAPTETRFVSGGIKSP